MMSSVSTIWRGTVLTVLLKVLLLNRCNGLIVTAHGAFTDLMGFTGGYFKCSCRIDTDTTQTTSCNYTSYDTYLTYTQNDYNKTCDNIKEFPVSVNKLDRGADITFILSQKHAWSTKDPVNCLLLTAQQAVGALCMQRVFSTQPTTKTTATMPTTTSTEDISTMTTTLTSTNTESTTTLVNSTSVPPSTQIVTTVSSSTQRTSTSGPTTASSTTRRTSSSGPTTASSTQRTSTSGPTTASSTTQRTSTSGPTTASSTQRTSTSGPTTSSSTTRRTSTSGSITAPTTQRTFTFGPTAASSSSIYEDTPTTRRQGHADVAIDTDTAIVLGVGCALGALLLAVAIIGVCVLCCARRRRNKDGHDMESTDGSWRDTVLSTGKVVIPRGDTNSGYSPSMEIMYAPSNYSPASFYSLH